MRSRVNYCEKIFQTNVLAKNTEILKTNGQCQDLIKDLINLKNVSVCIEAVRKPKKRVIKTESIREKEGRMEAKFRYVDLEASNQLKGKDQLSHPDIVEGVGGISWVVYEAVSSIVTLWEGDPELRVNVFHELSSIVHRLDWIRVYNTCLLLQPY